LETTTVTLPGSPSACLETTTASPLTGALLLLVPLLAMATFGLFWGTAALASSLALSHMLFSIMLCSMYSSLDPSTRDVKHLCVFSIQLKNKRTY